MCNLGDFSGGEVELILKELLRVLLMVLFAAAVIGLMLFVVSHLGVSGNAVV